jgi:hypothetical protein
MVKRKNNKSRREERRFTVRGVRRDPPDLGKLSRALIGLAQAEAEREAQAEQAARSQEEAATTRDMRSTEGGEPDA